MNVDASAVKVLLSAASKGDQKQVDKCLRKVPVDSVDEQSQTALHYACANGHDELVRHLIKRGAPLECRNWSGWVPIMLASCYGYVEIVNLLIQNNANVNVTNDRSVTPLTCAAGFGQMQVVEILLEHGAEISPNPELNKEIYVTPLMAAAQHGYVKIVNLLLQYNIKATDYCNPDTGYSALMIAATNGHLKIVQLLIEKGGADTNLINMAGQTAYGLSLLKKKTEVSAYLKNRTMRRVKVPSIERSIIEATKLLDLELVKRCFEEKKGGVNMTDENGATPLVFACLGGSEEIVRFLLQNGANPNAQDNTYGWTPLMQSTLKRQVDIIMLLLRHGADISIRNNENLTAFDIATRVGMPEITRLLAPSANGGYDHIEEMEKKMKGTKQTFFEKVSGKIGMKQRPCPKFNRVPVQLGDVADDEDTEELKKTSSVLSVFDANKAMSGSAKARISLLSPQVLLPNDVVAPTLPPFSKLPGFDLPKMPIVSTRLSSSNGSNTEWSPKNSSDDSTSFQAHIQNMGKKKSRNLKRPQQEVNNIPVPSSSKEPDSPQSSMTSSGFTSISQLQGPAVMPKQFKKDLSPMLAEGIEFQKPPPSAWLPPTMKDVSGFDKVPKIQSDLYKRPKKKSASTLPDIHNLSIKSLSSDVDQPKDLETLLRNLSLEDYHANFEEEEVDLEALKEMDDNDLKMIGIDKTVNRARILDAVGRKKKISKSKSHSVHNVPVNSSYQPLFVPSRPGSSTSAPVDLKLAPLPAYPGISKEKLTAI